MIRWMILAVLVVGVTTAATVAVQYLPADVTSGRAVPASRKLEVAGPPPRMVVEPGLVHGFGRMSEESTDTTSWVVRNEGEGPLRMRYQSSPCTCTHIRFGADGPALKEGDLYVIEPGEQAELFLTWETRDNRGEFRTYAAFSTNDLENYASASFTVEGLVLPSLMVLPPNIEFPSAPNDQEATASVLIYSPSHPDTAIVDGPTTSRPEFLSAEIRRLTDEEVAEATVEGMEAGYELKVTLRPGMPLGNFYDSIHLGTDHPVRPRVDLPVSGRVLGPITPSPSRVNLVGVARSQGGRQRLTLSVRNHDRTEFEVVVPDDARDLFDVTIEPVERPADAPAAPLRQYRMTVEVLPGAEPRQYSGELVLRTDHPQAAEVKIPYTVLVRGG